MTSIRIQRVGRWFPAGTESNYGKRPEVGDVVAADRAAWTVTHVRVDDPTEEESAYLKALIPSAREARMPYSVTLHRTHGPKHERENSAGDVACRVSVAYWRYWDVYPSGRVPLCSCCGDPYPCHMLDAERDAEAEAERMSTRMDRTMPGCCYGCGEPITVRQKTVRYPEPNVQVPGAPPPVFHMRNACFWHAHDYEKDRRRLHPDVAPIATDHGWQLETATLTTAAEETS